MEALIIIIFVIGYLAITLEHPLKIDKAVSAILLGIITWTVYAMLAEDYHEAQHNLHELLPEIMNILFFLLGAMTIVELIDIHEGFSVITNQISSKQKRNLLFIVGIISFFLSAVLDNLTTAIVMASLLRKLIHQREDRLIFASMVVIAANAGGAWSPIGDVTTTMLWIGDRISAFGIIKQLFLPSLVCLLVPLFVQMFFLKGTIEERPVKKEYTTSSFERKTHSLVGNWKFDFCSHFQNSYPFTSFYGNVFRGRYYVAYHRIASSKQSTR